MRAIQFLDKASSSAGTVKLRNVMQCYITLCNVMLCHSMLCSVMICYDISCKKRKRK